MIKKIIFLLFVVFYLTNANSENLANELKELNKLFKSGQITEEQFKKSKAKLIGIDYKPPKKAKKEKKKTQQVAKKMEGSSLKVFRYGVSGQKLYAIYINLQSAMPDIGILYLIIFILST